jgi:hypothetical protein
MGQTRRIVLCADDYALAPGVSSAIRTLLANARINATSVMVVTPELAAEARALTALPSPLKIEIGLHVTLTGGFKPLRENPLPTEDGLFPPLGRLLRPTARFGMSRRSVEAEVGAQIEAFRGACGRLPDFVDGHQHVQLLPGVRHAFLNAVARAAPKAWVRQCGPLRWRRLLAADLKALALAWWSLGFRALARRRGLAMNAAFTGAYDYAAAADFGALFEDFLAGLPEGGLVMCHPGFVDETLRTRDPLTDRRQTEYEFLAGDGLPAALARAGVRLA